MIDNAMLERVLGLTHKEAVACETMGPLLRRSPRLLSFLADEAFLEEARTHPSLEAVFTTRAMADDLRDSRVHAIVCDEPRYCFAVLYNHWAQGRYTRRPTIIDPSARIHPRAFVADHNVTVGPDVVVEAHAAILPDVQIGAGSHIHAGAVLGGDGFESKHTSKGRIAIFHDGQLVLGSNVRVGANALIDKGIYGRDTIIGDDTTIGPLSYIAHSVHVGRDCSVIGTAVVCGSSTVEDGVRIGPNATISNALTVHTGGRVHLGAVVTRHVEEGQSAFGKFAIPHERLLALLKRRLS